MYHISTDGCLVDEAALTAVLKDGRLFGAGIDAFANEPPVGGPLLEPDNTLIILHHAGAALGSFAGLAARAVENARAVSRSEPLSETDVAVAPDRQVPVA